MKWVGLLLVAGCGRLDFDPTATVDATAGSFGFRDLCSFTTYTIITDAIPIDDNVGASIASALASGCNVTATKRTVSQAAPGILDPGSGRPLLGATDLAVIGGGDGPQRATAYLLAHGLPITWSGSSTVTFRERSTSRVISSGPVSDTHDYALVVIGFEPTSHTRVVSVSGAVAQGTVAGGIWFGRLAQTIATDTDAWSLVEWTDSDGVTGATANDQYRLVESGH